MTAKIDLGRLLTACADDSFDDGIRVDADLQPLARPGGLVKPAVYEGGNYQLDRRWTSPDDAEPTPVVVIDNVPSQANAWSTPCGETVRRVRSLSSFLTSLS